MGILKCPRCKAKTTADSIEEGRSRLDHSNGLYRSKPCYNGLVQLEFTADGSEKSDNSAAKAASKTSDKATFESKTKSLKNSAKNLFKSE